MKLKSSVKNSSIDQNLRYCKNRFNHWKIDIQKNQTSNQRNFGNYSTIPSLVSYEYRVQLNYMIAYKPKLKLWREYCSTYCRTLKNMYITYEICFCLYFSVKTEPRVMESSERGSMHDISILELSKNNCPKCYVSVVLVASVQMAFADCINKFYMLYLLS